MITKSFLILLACFVGLLVIQKTIAVRLAPNIEEFMGENHRTRSRTRQNFFVQRALDEELSANIDNLAAIPETIDADSSPGEVTSPILGCANMIRNDIVYSDDCIKTTTRKRGKKNLAMTVPPCTCGSKNQPIRLGEDFFPTRLENIECLNTCPPPFRCKAIHYWALGTELTYAFVANRKVRHLVKLQEKGPAVNALSTPFLLNEGHFWVTGIIAVTVLKRLTRASSIEVPVDFRRWESLGINVTTSCVCTPDSN